MFDLTGSASQPTEGIDVVLRIHSPPDIASLDRALFSLVHQSYHPVHPIIVTQNLTFDQRDHVEKTALDHDWQFEHMTPTIIHYRVDQGVDARSRLLNVGVRNARLRFFAVLDYDDYLYEYAYQYLIDKLKTQNATIAFGGIVVSYVHDLTFYQYKIREFHDKYVGHGIDDLFIDNFCPIHSFVLDRHKIAVEDMIFEEGIARLEDYDFFLRICSKYQPYFESRVKKIGVYNWQLGGTNLDASGSPIAHEDDPAWLHARQHIEGLKSRLRAAS